MTTWPNWVDLVVVTVLLRTCYSGFGRGLLAEFLNVVLAVGVVSLTVNLWQPLSDIMLPWLPWVRPPVSFFVVFSLLFLSLFVVTRLAVRRLTELLRWERLHWSIQGMGLVLGGLRGLWWSGFVVIILTASGVTYLSGSVENSVLGPRLGRIAREGVALVADRFPGARERSDSLVPPMKAGAH